MVAFDAASGKQLWQTFTVDPPKPTKKNKLGTQQYAPSGVAIWSAPTIDLKRGALYVATGNEYSGPGGPTSDAVIALDLKSGKMLWTSQVTPKDVYVVGCNASRENCPDDEGPDFDFGNSAILRDLPGGKRVIVIGQKSGVVWALDPDNKGAIVWQRRVGKRQRARRARMGIGGRSNHRLLPGVGSCCSARKRPAACTRSGSIPARRCGKRVPRAPTARIRRTACRRSRRRSR